MERPRRGRTQALRCTGDNCVLARKINGNTHGMREVWLAVNAKASVSERLARFAQVVWNAVSLDEIRFVEKTDNE